MRTVKSDLAPPAANNWGFFHDPAHDALIARIHETFDIEARDAIVQERHDKVLDDALVAHDMTPRATSRRASGFVQAQSWFQDLTPIALS